MFGPPARVAVILGGKSQERPGSLASGKAVVASLNRQGFEVLIVDPMLEDSLKLLDGADVAFNVLHGRWGEDGCMQGYLETVGIPYTGSGVIGSSLGLNKLHTKRNLLQAGLPTPRFEYVGPGEDPALAAGRCVDSLGLPLFSKPVSGGGSLGAAVIKSPKQLAAVLEKGVADGFPDFIVEEFVAGAPVSVGVLQIDHELAALPPLEVETGREFFDYEAKHEPSQRTYFCPGRFDDVTTKGLKNRAIDVHEALSCWGYSRVDFIVGQSFGRKKGVDGDDVCVLEINTNPGMSVNGNLPIMAAAAGISYDQLVATILDGAFKRPGHLV